MQVTKVAIDKAGASVEVFDGWKSVYKFRIAATGDRVTIPGGFLAGRVSGSVSLWAPCTVAEELPPQYGHPSGAVMPPDFKYLHLEGCCDAMWFKDLIRQIVRGLAK